MQALRNIFSIWGVNRAEGLPDFRAMATALDEKEDTVYRWYYRRRIPDRAWNAVIAKAAELGKVITVADMHAANTPTKPRGGHRKAPKIKARRRRDEQRVIS